MKKVLLLLMLSSAIFGLVGCSKSEDIESGKVESVKVEVTSTDHDKEDFFSLIPITTSDGKNVRINYIPIWNEIEELTVNYRYQDKDYKTKTDDFVIKKSEGGRYAEISKNDIGKGNAPIVLYTNDKNK
ncbi:hypothetical protein [Lactococcus lactis]|uniref:hypothetical protein n=1 Tax=Lactococcus lactis TaxID=1358 RepID=UPI00191178E1|nr:hypothetical protein [Lactococcus lactis]WDA68473.1 hypothetical protein IL310_13235 [Lactococcus lactis]